MKSVRHLIRMGLCVALAACGVAHAAYPDPNKTMKIIVPFPAGGSTDVFGRLLAQALQDKLKTTVIVENKPGGSTVIATTALVRSTPDAHTLLLTSDATFAINPHILENPPYDVLKDITPVSLLSATPNWIVVPTNSKLKDFSSFVEASRNSKVPTTIAVNVARGHAHLALNAWAKRNGLNVSVVPYLGGSKPFTDLVGGNLDAMVDIPGGTLPHVNAGTLRPLTILQQKPSPILPKVPHLTAETDQGLNVVTSFVLFTTAGSPKASIDKLYAALKEIVAQPAIQARMKEFPMETVMMDPEKTGEFVRQSNALFMKIVAESGLADK